MISRRTRHTAYGVLAATLGIAAVMIYLAISSAPPSAEDTAQMAGKDGDQSDLSQAKKPSAAPKIGAKVALAERSIAPGAITPPPPVTGPLIRIKDNKPPKPDWPPPPTTVTLRPVAVVDAGALRNRDLTVLLARIKPLGLDSTCTTEQGTDWPCGRHARTALRRLIRGRAVVCWRTDGGAFDGDLVEAECRIGKRNISGWLVEQGWALLSDSADEMDNRLEAAARQAKRGQWRGRIESVGLPPTQSDVLSLDFSREDLNLPTLDVQPFDLPDTIETDPDTSGPDVLAIDGADATGPVADLPYADGVPISPELDSEQWRLLGDAIN